MIVTELRLPGVMLIEPDVFRDPRGFFLETFQAQRYREAAGITLPFVQDNHSRSPRGVLRGLHAQHRYPQGKLVRVARGEVFDVSVDIDPASPYFGVWTGAVLSDDNQRQLWIPPGYAHGFLVLSDVADFEYKCTDYYVPDDEVGLVWDDSAVGIDWPLADPVLSDKDRAWPTLAQIKADR
ncbi:dTDP-4-dehydrorhamnose 3,5-epimerase [Spiribacter vilamensis]|uniref:dTDP-4-dehydrorhamnose 3,5-epimerase n=1 Tax=Spiribacter vilamensis TaxID=531306 RepID=A0A4Q8CZK1_9GAMM|nr:dTDP-4-dehydrorhamnose 3,5-epimerase [Spiribacter vilamensis]RZU98350.1 dTDP-4-dehydrorhamnose 3,5-epimerase [Spiribacter vilamensis]TVO60767.1 dTDP-4-dehydrorhamnose 3,5-epimerase [Spiribacter vilamensis]